MNDNGCLEESFGESAVIERIGAMMENFRLSSTTYLIILDNYLEENKK